MKNKPLKMSAKAYNKREIKRKLSNIIYQYILDSTIILMYLINVINHSLHTMLNTDYRPSLKLLNQIATIERFAGNWEKIVAATQDTSPEYIEQSLIEGAEAISELDCNVLCLSSGSLSYSHSLENIVIAHKTDLELSAETLAHVFQTISGATLEHADCFRTYPQPFTTKFTKTETEEIVFPTVSAFLVKSRLEKLLIELYAELEESDIHPLIAIGLFHLLFLQISPFKSANHSVALISMWKLLSLHGYDFVSLKHPASFFAQAPEQYFKVLRQGEKTAGNNWSTINIWLEFFLDSLIELSTSLQTDLEKSVKQARLTDVQSKIIEAITSQGACTRERIANETGVHLSTVKYNLSVLTNRGYLLREGGGRSTNYRLR